MLTQEVKVKVTQPKVKKLPQITKAQKTPRVQTPPSTKKKKGLYPIPPKKRMPVLEATQIMQTYWPNLFDEVGIKPLQIGIHTHLKEDAKAKELPITGKMIQRCLSSLTYNFVYRFRIQEGQPRFDKDGVICSLVTVEEELDSKERILRNMKQQATTNPFVSSVFYWIGFRYQKDYKNTSN